MNFKAAVLIKAKKPLQIINDLRIEKLKRGQVLVRVLHSAICRSQIMEIEGKSGVWVLITENDYDMARGNDGYYANFEPDDSIWIEGELKEIQYYGPIEDEFFPVKGTVPEEPSVAPGDNFRIVEKGSFGPLFSPFGNASDETVINYVNGQNIRGIDPYATNKKEFSDAVLESALFSDVVFRDVIFSNLTLNDTFFVDCRFERVSFYNVDFNRAVFSNGSFDTIMFENVSVDNGRFDNNEIIHLWVKDSEFSDNSEEQKLLRAVLFKSELCTTENFAQKKTINIAEIEM